MRRDRYRGICRLAAVLACLGVSLAFAAPLSTSVEHATALGRAATYLQERQARLDWPAALAAARAGRYTPGTSPVLNFGIGAPPTWIHLAVDNPTASAVRRRLSIETAWLDRIEVYLVQQDRLVSRHLAGDRLPYARREGASRYFVFDPVFAPGVSDVLIRVETPDPMVVPITLLGEEAAIVRQTRQELSYGVVYGFLFALLAYNAILYVSLRSRRYLLYAVYLAAFVAMNVAYTGHGYALLWPASPNWQQWSNPILIVLYGVAGFAFAIRFLDLQVYYPRLRRLVIAYSAVVLLLLGGAVAIGSQVAALLVAFTFAFLFAFVMLVLGVMAMRAGQKPARYFLLAAMAAMIGAVLTTLSTWGFIPYNSWTFRAVELGMLVDATLLALALGYQFRVGQDARVRAERLAHLDPLTGTDNRRAFYDKTRALWSNAQRHGHDAAVLLLDIDHFKHVNDTHGHAHGDAVLRGIAETLRQSVREGDLVARWGGEEFIVYMPDTSLREAQVLAERLREAVGALRVTGATGSATTVTASLGVAQKEIVHPTLDALIAVADECLYQAKAQGRNRVVAWQGVPPVAGACV